MQQEQSLRKKRSSHNDLEGPPSKRQSSASFDTSLEDVKVFTDPQVLLVQKRGLSASLQESKAQIASLKEQIRNLERKQSSTDQSLKLMENLHLILGRVDETASVNEIVLPKKKEKGTLLELLLDKQTKDKENNQEEGEICGEIESALRKRSEETNDLLVRIVTAVDNWKNLYTNGIAALVDSTSKESLEDKMKVISEDNAKCRAEVSTLRGTLDTLHFQYKTLGEECEELRAAKIRLEEKVKEQADALATAQDSLDGTNRKLQLLQLKYQEQSEQLQQVQQQLAASPSTATPSTPSSQSLLPASPSPARTPSISLKDSTNSMPLTTDATADSRLKQLEDELAAANIRVQQRKEQVDKYELERERFFKEIARLEKECSSPSEDKVKHSNTYLHLQHQLDYCASERDSIRTTYERLVNEHNALVVSSKAEREKLAAAEASRREALERDLRDAELRLVRLKSERDTLQQRLEFKNATPNPAQLVKELKSLLAAKDAELKRLKESAQSAKLTERSKVKELQQKAASSSESADDAVKELQAQLDAVIEEREALLADIEDIAKGYEEAQQQISRFIQQLAEKEDTVAQLVSEQVKNTQLLGVLKEEKALLTDKISKCEDKCQKLEELLGKSEAKLKLLNEQNKKLSEELKFSIGLVEGLKRSARENSHSCTEFKTQVQKLQQEADASRRTAEEMTLAAEKKNQKVLSLEEELQVLHNKLERLNQSGTDALLEEEVKLLKSKLTCSVCNDRQKSAIITRCYHVFCRPCIQKNLEVRSRKCPGCGKPFAETDVHNIYL